MVNVMLSLLDQNIYIYVNDPFLENAFTASGF